MLIRVNRFAGVAPRMEAQHLPPYMATEAINCKLWSGNLRPYFGVKDLGIALFKAGTGIVDSLFRFGVTPADPDDAGYFFHWQGIAHAARVPVPGDNLWTTVITGDGLKPRITDSAIGAAGPDYPSDWEELGLPVPDVSGSNAVVAGEANGDADPATDAVRRDYVIAYVNTRGQLGPTSVPILTDADWLPGQRVDLTGLPTAPAGDFTVISKRIYRLGAGGTIRYFVAEVGVADTSYSDTVHELALGEQSLSAGWEQPPAGMHNIGVLSNGISYGFYRNQVCVSEAWLPHAWNPLNRETVNYDIVGGGHFGTTIVAVTGENPYLIYGFAADQMRQQKLEVNQGGLSQQGIVSGKFGVAFPSKDGLVLVNGPSPIIATDSYFTRDEWQDLAPETFKAALFADRYFAFYDNGVPGGILIDPRDAEAGVVFTDVAGTALYSDPVARALYIVQEGRVRQWDADRANPLTYTWRSKEFVSQHQVAVNWGRILADSYANLAAEFYVDGELRHTETVTSGKPFPMPQGTKGRVFQFRLIGTDTVTEAAFASNPKEFRA